jgi:transposase
MEQVRVERLDHLGVIVSVINDLGLSDMIDSRLVPDQQELITPGEAVAGMILNGLGFANRPLSFTPQLFASRPLDRLFREGIAAEMFNRLKLGRTLDEASTYGCNHADNASRLQRIGFITRLPNTLGVGSQVIRQALGWDTWQPVDDNTRDQPLELCHDGMAQRWLVVYSQAACERAAATRKTATQREAAAINQALSHLPAPRCPTPEAAQEALAAVATRWMYHRVESYRLSAHKHYAGRGRPTPHTPVKASEGHIQAHVRADDATIAHHQHVKACFILGTHIDARELSHAEVIAAYQGQAHVEGGFRVLKELLLFVSSWFVKKPNRLDGRLMVMRLAWLVYSVAQRRLRTQLATHQETVPNQLHQPTTSPTLRWVFPLLEGIHRVRVMVQGQVYDLIEGLNDVQIHLLRVFGHKVCRLYQISAG